MNDIGVSEGKRGSSWPLPDLWSAVCLNKGVPSVVV
jgi:hypothetical protein